MITIQQNLKAISVNKETVFSQQGAVDPIVWSIKPDGAGGSIDADGVYTAPANLSVDAKKSFDTVMVEDANGDTAEATIMVLPYIGLIANIIQEELGLGMDQVFLYQQKYNVPKDSRLYVSVGQLSAKPFGTCREYDRSGPGLVEVITTQWRVIADVEIFSASTTAFLRKEEITMALNSTYGEQMQEANNFKIGLIPVNFTNISHPDGAGIPYRFNIAVPVLYTTRKTKSVPYFDVYEDNETNVDS